MRRSEARREARRECSVAQQAGEPGLKLVFREELLRGRRFPRREVVRVAVHQELGCIDEDLGGRPPGMDRDEFDPVALIVSEFEVHGLSVCSRVRGVSIELW